ncbi:MAG: ATP-binding protein [Eubacteriales bacterium]|nr:ATP-binding protein [Eubacteriales bacterium]
MSNENTNPLNIIEEANSKTLDYFNRTYVSNLELVQGLKTELFELDMQIDTLERTRELYTYHIDTRRNVFSPVSDTPNSTSITKGRQIELQIQDLQDAKKRLENRIAELEEDIAFYKEQVEMLSQASKCIHTVLVGRHPEEPEDDELEAIEFIEQEEVEHDSNHGYNLFRLEDYEHYHMASNLDQNVKQELIANLNKMDVLKWLLHSDVSRAKITLDELLNSSKSILHSIDDLLEDLNYHIDTKQPIWDQINKLMNRYQDMHPECMIDASCDCTEHDISLPSVITYRLVGMIKEVFDNVFKHSNANKVTAKVFISSRLIDVYINDNGVGIPEDYLDRSDWSSGLHRLQEIIYQLDGKLQITGDLISGTNVRFSFPIKEN